MAAQQKPEPGTAVAKRDDTTSAASLDAAGKRHLAEIRARNALVVAITNESWGQKMSPMMRRAFAEYIRRFKLDVSEVDNLGGRPYRNGRYYERRIAEMRTRGLVDWTHGEHIGPDPRLDALAEQGDTWAVEETTRRLRERIRWAVPEDATHAYVARVKLKGDQNPLEGCDWITPERTKKTQYGEKIADPVGAEEPEKTVITRAWRRAGLLAAAEIPELRDEEEALDAGAAAVAEEVEQIGAREAQRELSSAKPKHLMPGVRHDDPYSVDEAAPAQATRDVKGEAHQSLGAAGTLGTSPSAAQRAPVDEAASVPDPYEQELDLDDQRFPDDE